MSERKIKDWAWPYINNFRTYIDIGASTGTTSSPFIHSFEKIYCFEPNPNSFKELSKFPKLICHNCALGDTNEKKLLIMKYLYRMAIFILFRVTKIYNLG